MAGLKALLAAVTGATGAGSLAAFASAALFWACAVAAWASF